MIKLAGSSTVIFESQVFSHPPQNNFSYADYNITHNKGSIPTLTKVYVDGQGNGLFHQMIDANGVYGYEAVNDSTINNQHMVVYRYGGNTVNIKFKLFWFN